MMSRVVTTVDKRIEAHDDGLIVVVPIDARPVTPICCPNCSVAMRTQDDEASFAKFGCCMFCEIEWARPCVERWFAGERPSRAVIDAAVAVRPRISVSV